MTERERGQKDRNIKFKLMFKWGSDYMAFWNSSHSVCHSSHTTYVYSQTMPELLFYLEYSTFKRFVSFFLPSCASSVIQIKRCHHLLFSANNQNVYCMLFSDDWCEIPSSQVI